jgi:putative transcriptional regulator
MSTVLENRLIRWKLRELMARKKKTNQEVADVLQKHWTTISRWRTSDEMPKIDGAELDGLCKALDCQLLDLIEQLPDEDN